MDAVLTTRTRRGAAKRGLLLALLLVSAIGPALAGEQKAGSEARLAAARLHASSFVRVEVTLRYDRGQAPSSIAHTDPFALRRDGYWEVIAQERPYVLSGLLLAPDRVLTGDIQLHDRFVASYHVVAGDRRVAARPVAWGRDQRAVFLALEEKLEGVSPLVFEADAPGPYVALRAVERRGEIQIDTEDALTSASLRADGSVVNWTAWHGALIVAPGGKAVGVATYAGLPSNGSWRASPLDWPVLDEAGMAARRVRMEAHAGRLLPRVHLAFRSPRSSAGEASAFSRTRSRDAAEVVTELDVCGLIVGERRVLVLAALDAAETARLERVEIHVEGAGAPVQATFQASLKEYGALLVETQSPLGEPLRLSEAEPAELLNAFLWDVQVEVQGRQRVSWIHHTRVESLDVSWRSQRVPANRTGEDTHILFDAEERLACVPIARRKAARDRWERTPQRVLLPALYVREILADDPAVLDASNVPLPPQEENRIAWLGIEAQKLDRELARANGVSHLTRDGQIGVLVSYVYSGSPAAQRGLEPGAILLRLHAPDRPNPVDITIEEDMASRFGSMFSALGERLLGLLDRYPGFTPWPSVDNELNRAITKSGFGKPFEVEYVVDGERQRAAFAVEASPPHFGSAASAKDEPLGITVRELTYEVRRYMQLEADAPGLIIAKIESGLPAQVAGLLPFEVITHVEGEPLTSLSEWKEALEAGGELNLKVRRQSQERVVKLSR